MVPKSTHFLHTLVTVSASFIIIFTFPDPVCLSIPSLRPLSPANTQHSYLSFLWMSRDTKSLLIFPGASNAALALICLLCLLFLTAYIFYLHFLFTPTRPDRWFPSLFGSAGRFSLSGMFFSPLSSNEQLTENCFCVLLKIHKKNGTDYLLSLCTYFKHFFLSFYPPVSCFKICFY